MGPSLKFCSDRFSFFKLEAFLSDATHQLSGTEVLSLLALEFGREEIAAF